MQVLFNVLMGLRCSEIIAVKYSDVDYINRTLKVERQLGRTLAGNKEDFAPKTLTKQEVKPKTKSSTRELPIPDYVFEAPKAVSKLMGHAKEIITIDVYGNNQEMTAEDISELEVFMDEVIHKRSGQRRFREDLLDIEIDVSEYLPAS
jgi:hypothetical protein